MSNLVAASGRWWACPKPNPDATLRLLCFPYAGGNAAMFRHWQPGLPPWVEVCAVQLPGRTNRIADRPFTRIRHLAAAVSHAAGPLLEKPVALFGHSMGALLAFELARLIRREWGVQPAHLFVSGRRAPQLPQTKPVRFDADDEHFVAALKSLNGTPAEVLRNPELFRMILPALRADFEAVETYQFTVEPPLACPITVFGGRDDDESIDDRLGGWRAQTTHSRFRQYLLPGNHFFIHTNAPELLSLTSNELIETAGFARISSGEPNRAG